MSIKRHLSYASKLSIDKSWIEQNYKALVALLIMFLLLPVGFGAGTVSLIVFEKTRNLYSNMHSVSKSINGSVAAGVANIKSWVNVRSQNIAMQTEIDKLQQELLEQKALVHEASELKNLLKIKSNNTKIIGSAKIIMHASGSYLDYATIKLGTAHGVSPNQIVVADGKVIGRILESSDNFSTIILVTSTNSTISGWLLESKQRVLLTGTPDKSLAVKFLDGTTPPKQEELIVTTGDEGYYKPDLLLGKVIKINSDTNIVVKPLADLNKISYVSVIEK